MYQSIWKRYLSVMPKFPTLRRLRVGSAIKETRVNNGIQQKDFAVRVDINESTLKSIENDHQSATTVANLERCASALDLSVDDLIFMGREKDPANFFVLKENPWVLLTFLTIKVVSPNSP